MTTDYDRLREAATEGNLMDTRPLVVHLRDNLDNKYRLVVRVNEVELLEYSLVSYGGVHQAISNIYGLDVIPPIVANNNWRSIVKEWIATKTRVAVMFYESFE